MLKLVELKTIDMELPTGYAPMLTCGELETLIADHNKGERKQLKFVIKIYEVQKDA